VGFTQRRNVPKQPPAPVGSEDAAVTMGVGLTPTVFELAYTMDRLIKVPSEHQAFAKLSRPPKEPMEKEPPGATGKVLMAPAAVRQKSLCSEERLYGAHAPKYGGRGAGGGTGDAGGGGGDVGGQGGGGGGGGGENT